MYIELGKYHENDKVEVIDPSDKVHTGRVFRITPQKGNYCLISVLTDVDKEIVVVQYNRKINKIA